MSQNINIPVLRIIIRSWDCYTKCPIVNYNYVQYHSLHVLASTRAIVLKYFVINQTKSISKFYFKSDLILIFARTTWIIERDLAIKNLSCDYELGLCGYIWVVHV